MKLKTWLMLHYLAEQFDKPKIWKSLAFYILGWAIIVYFFDLFSSWHHFLLMFVGVMLIARGLKLDHTAPCPAETNCPFKDRMIKGYWEKKK